MRAAQQAGCVRVPTSKSVYLIVDRGIGGVVPALSLPQWAFAKCLPFFTTRGARWQCRDADANCCLCLSGGGSVQGIEATDSRGAEMRSVKVVRENWADKMEQR
jgi:hypothetical protein